MAGFCGVIGKGEVDKDKLLHRGKPASHAFKDANFYSFGLNAENVFSQDSLVLVDGIVYNGKEISNEHFGRELSTAELFLRIYEKFGMSGFDLLDGFFSAVLYNGREILLVSDHAGTKSIYYTFSNNVFAFSPEQKALLNFAAPSINLDALKELGYFGWNGSSIFCNIFCVKPGSALLFKDNKIREYEYHKFPEKELAISDEQAVSTFIKLLENSIQKLFSENQAFFLSGGIDSSVLIAVAKKLGMNCKAYISEKIKDIKEDVGCAKLVAEKFNTKLEVLKFNGLFKRLPESIWHLENPIDSISLSQINNFLVSEHISKNHSAGICGLGIDELLEKRDTYDDPGSRKEWMSFLSREFPQLGLKNEPKLHLKLHSKIFLPFFRLRMFELNSSASGLDRRYPYLSKDIFDFCLSLPESLAVRNDKSKFLLRLVAKKLNVPDEIINRPRDPSRFPHPEFIEFTDFCSSLELPKQEVDFGKTYNALLHVFKKIFLEKENYKKNFREFF